MTVKICSMTSNGFVTMFHFDVWLYQSVVVYVLNTRPQQRALLLVISQNFRPHCKQVSKNTEWDMTGGIYTILVDET